MHDKRVISHGELQRLTLNLLEKPSALYVESWAGPRGNRWGPLLTAWLSSQQSVKQAWVDAGLTVRWRPIHTLGLPGPTHHTTVPQVQGVPGEALGQGVRLLADVVFVRLHRTMGVHNFSQFGDGLRVPELVATLASLLHGFGRPLTH